MSEDEQEKEKLVLDLSRRELKKVPKNEDAQNVKVLILDENELQKIDNIDSYLKIEKLSLSKNQLLRMYGVCRLHHLVELNLSFNGILSIEGLKDCIHLKALNLEGNNIKTIEHLNNTLKLEYLNLAHNNIGNISDISFLKNLKELYLHGNRLTHLRQCDKYLPVSLENLTLAKNNISDLNEICFLVNLTRLHSITINENPCVSITNGPNGMEGFDHRPFVLNWCMSVQVIDGFAVDPIESLKAEWLYSQGRGRQFRLGEQAALAKYLSSVCPLIGKALENENERKLRLILSKAQHHQRQLQEEISENSSNSCSNSPSSGRKKINSRIQSPRFSGLNKRQGSPDFMISSYHGTTSNINETSNNSMQVNQMTTSLIENLKNDSYETVYNNNNSGSKSGNSQENSTRSSTPSQHNGPLAAASKMVPVPETLISPDVCPVSVAQRMTASQIHQTHHKDLNSMPSHTCQNPALPNSKIKNKEDKMNSPNRVRSPNMKRNNNVMERSPNVSPRKVYSKTSQINILKANQSNSSMINDNSHINKVRYCPTKANLSSPTRPELNLDISSDDESDNINVDKLKTIRNKAAQKYQEKKENNFKIEHNDTTILSAILIQKMWRGYRTRKKTKDIAEKLLKKRTQEYIDKLTKDMEMTKVQLENERKIQQLQMQAINALWKRISSMQTLSHVQSRVSTGDPAANGITSNLPDMDAAKVLSLDDSSTAIVNDLTKTCTMLTSQVQQLQGSMRDILNCLTIFCNIPQENVKSLLSVGVSEALSSIDSTKEQNTHTNEKISKDSAGTQTDITAVHTPQTDSQATFPFISKIRPSSLPLHDGQKQAHNAKAATLITNDATNLIDDHNTAADRSKFLDKILQSEIPSQDAGSSGVEITSVLNLNELV